MSDIFNDELKKLQNEYLNSSEEEKEKFLLDKINHLIYTLATKEMIDIGEIHNGIQSFKDYEFENTVLLSVLINTYKDKCSKSVIDDQFILLMIETELGLITRVLPSSLSELFEVKEVELDSSLLDKEKIALDALFTLL